MARELNVTCDRCKKPVAKEDFQTLRLADGTGHKVYWDICPKCVGELEQTLGEGDIYPKVGGLDRLHEQIEDEMSENLNESRGLSPDFED